MIDRMIRDLCALLGGREELSHVRFVTEYPGKQMEGPLRRPTVCIGLDGAEITDAGIGRLIGSDTRGCRAEVTVGMGFYIPFSGDVQEAYRILSDVTDVLLFDSAYALSRMNCGGLTADRNTGAFVMHVSFTFQVDFIRGNLDDGSIGCGTAV